MSSYSAPVAFDNPHYSVSPEKYYGSLLTPDNRPSQVLARLADALFLHIDSSCPLPGLQNTGLIEPAKYAWYMLRNGATVEAATLMTGACQSYYDLARLPYCFVADCDGDRLPVSDRRAFLHMAVFDARSDPDEFVKEWSRAITRFDLKDPLTSKPFPTPLPCSCLPEEPEPYLRAIVDKWIENVCAEAAQMLEEDAAGIDSQSCGRPPRVRQDGENNHSPKGRADVNATGMFVSRSHTGDGEDDSNGDGDAFDDNNANAGDDEDACGLLAGPDVGKPDRPTVHDDDDQGIMG